METNLNFQDIFTVHENVLSKKRSLKSTVRSSVMIVGGIIAAVLVMLFLEDRTSSFYLLSISAATLVIIIGFVMLIWGGSEFIYTPTRSVAQEYSLYFKPEESSKLVDAIKSGNMADIKKIKMEPNGGLRLDVILSEDHKFASCQVFRYVPHSYEAVTEVYKIPESDRDSFCHMVKELNVKQNQ